MTVCIVPTLFITKDQAIKTINAHWSMAWQFLWDDEFKNILIPNILSI